MKEKRREPATIISLFNIQNLEDVAGILNRLEEGFDVNTVDLGGRTLLMQATIDRNHTLMKLLLQEGADPNVEDTRNWTALHFAAQNYDLPAAKILINAGANVNSRDDYGNTIVSTAVLNSRGQGEVIQFLVSHGADIKIRNKSGISAEDLAKTISNYDVAQFLE